MFGEKLYLSPVLDLCSSDLVSYTISERPVLSMVTTMLEKAFEKIPDNTNLILHSESGERGCFLFVLYPSSCSRSAAFMMRPPTRCISARLACCTAGVTEEVQSDSTTAS